MTIPGAVQNTQRNIPKAGILDNFDKILARELECGNFAKVAEDTYRLPPDGMPYELPMPKVLIAKPQVATSRLFF